MKIFRWLFQIFSIYTDAFEKEADRFFKKVKAHHNAAFHEVLLRDLMQRDLVRFNLFMERKYKGYHKLKKSYRKWCYQNAEGIKSAFAQHYQKHQTSLQNQLNQINLPHSVQKNEKLLYLFAIMNFLNPKNHRFVYRDGAAFEKLLRHPEKEKLIGDCNQIVTLYIYLFAQKFSIQDLRLKIMKGHICLHYQGVDIEATTGAFMQHKHFLYITNVEEIIPTNMLDISEKNEKLNQIPPKTFLQVAELAYLFSSHRALVEKNLRIAYRNLALYYTNERNYPLAEFFFQKAHAREALENLHKIAFQHFLHSKKYKKARDYARKVGDRRLEKQVTRAQAIELLENKKYQRARSKFQSIGDQKGVQASYQNELCQLYEKIKHDRTAKDYRSHKKILKQMQSLAQKSGNREVENFCSKILQEI